MTKMQNKTLSDIKYLEKLRDQNTKHTAHVEALQAESDVAEFSLKIITELQAENQALLAKNWELEAERDSLKSFKKLESLAANSITPMELVREALVKGISQMKQFNERIDRQYPNSVDYGELQENYDKGEVNEVEKALEELKEVLNAKDIGWDQRLKDHYKKHIRAQNLVNALEAEKDIKNKQRIDELKEVIGSYTIAGFIVPKKWIEELEELQRNMSKPEPKIDMKKECKETYRCAHNYVLKNQGYNNSGYLIKEYECSICCESKTTIRA